MPSKSVVFLNSLVSSSSSIKRDVTFDVMPDVPQRSILQFALDFNKIDFFLSVVLYELSLLSNVFGFSPRSLPLKDGFTVFQALKL